ncbi:MAG: 50S ribosomal protein L22 [Bacteroidota bacterium]
MGARKKISAEKIKEANKTKGFAKLVDCPTSPRKMRLVADIIRGVDVLKALHVLQHHPQHASRNLEKVLRSAIANWETKNEGKSTESLFVKEVYVDSARSIKRLRPAPQGRAYRVRKRSNHVTLVVDSKNN